MSQTTANRGTTRGRGDYPIPVGQMTPIPGPPPRARGLHERPGAASALEGTTPETDACSGNLSVPWPCVSLLGDHD
jgi:hypothetical protein